MVAGTLQQSLEALPQGFNNNNNPILAKKLLLKVIKEYGNVLPKLVEWNLNKALEAADKNDQTAYTFALNAYNEWIHQNKSARILELYQLLAKFLERKNIFLKLLSNVKKSLVILNSNWNFETSTGNAMQQLINEVKSQLENSTQNYNAYLSNKNEIYLDAIVINIRTSLKCLENLRIVLGLGKIEL